jgi:hypothetical protein
VESACSASDALRTTRGKPLDWASCCKCSRCTRPAAPLPDRSSSSGRCNVLPIQDQRSGDGLIFRAPPPMLRTRRCIRLLHDMGDPVGAATRVGKALRKDGAWMIVEPYANDELKDNLNPPRLRFPFHAPVHSVFAVAGGRPLSRGTVRRKAHPRCGHGRRLQPLPPSKRDAFNLVYEARL